MTKPKWFSGPPPSLGWWPASIWQCTGAYRWWNGECWSEFATEGDTLWEVSMAAANQTFSSECVKWQHRPKSWPERSKT